MLSALTKAQAFAFEPAFQVDPEAKLVAAALSRPYDPREKTVYASAVNVLGLLIARIAPDAQKPELKSIKVNGVFDPLGAVVNRWVKRN